MILKCSPTSPLAPLLDCVRPKRSGSTGNIISLSRKIIEVTAENAKNSCRRHAPICAALSEWLSPVAKLAGPLAPATNFRRREFAIRTAAGLTDADWQRHALRHSAASYRLALVQDAAKVALELGHEPGILLAHYRELTTPDEAAAWFSVVSYAFRERW